MPQAIQMDNKFFSLADKGIVNHDFLYVLYAMSQNVWMGELCCKYLSM